MNRALSPMDFIFPAGSVDFLALPEICLILRYTLVSQAGSSILAHLGKNIFLNPFILRILSALHWIEIPLQSYFSINLAIKPILAATHIAFFSPASAMPKIRFNWIAFLSSGSAQDMLSRPAGQSQFGKHIHSFFGTI
jgi:hypothetical protein